MTKTKPNNRIVTSPPSVDEEWWASLLSEGEESSMVSHAAPPAERHKFAAEPTHQLDWEEIQHLFHNDEIVRAQVTGYNQGGILVSNTDLQGFVPISHLIDVMQEIGEVYGEVTPSFDVLKPVLSAYVGRWLHLKVIECDPSRGRIVLSERAALAAPGRRNHLLNNLIGGEHVQGTVTNITDFGVFVDLGGLEGLIHISELSWGRVRHPGEILQLGQRIDVMVLQSDRDRCRVALSLKRLYANPWKTAEERFKVGQTVDVVITSIVSYGAFARVEQGLDGLIHCSEMCYPGGPSTPWEAVEEGQEICARVVHIDASRQRLGLSLKPAEA